MMTPKKWTYVRRQAATAAILSMAIIGVIAAGVSLADDEWPRLSTVIMTPLFFLWAIRRIATDVLTEFRDDALKSIEKRSTFR